MQKSRCLHGFAGFQSLSALSPPPRLDHHLKAQIVWGVSGTDWEPLLFVLLSFIQCFSPTAESFGVSAQIGSGVVRGGPDIFVRAAGWSGVV